MRKGSVLKTALIAIAGLGVVTVGGYRVMTGNCLLTGTCSTKNATATVMPVANVTSEETCAMGCDESKMVLASHETKAECAETECTTEASCDSAKACDPADCDPAACDTVCEEGEAKLVEAKAESCCSEKEAAGTMAEAKSDKGSAVKGG